MLQEFHLEFIKCKSSKSLVFVELLCDFLNTEMESIAKGSLLDDTIFIISTI